MKLIEEEVANALDGGTNSENPNSSDVYVGPLGSPPEGAGSSNFTYRKIREGIFYAARGSPDSRSKATPPQEAVIGKPSDKIVVTTTGKVYNIGKGEGTVTLWIGNPSSEGFNGISFVPEGFPKEVPQEMNWINMHPTEVNVIVTGVADNFPENQFSSGTRYFSVVYHDRKIELYLFDDKGNERNIGTFEGYVVSKPPRDLLGKGYMLMFSKGAEIKESYAVHVDGGSISLRHLITSENVVADEAFMENLELYERFEIEPDEKPTWDIEVDVYNKCLRIIEHGLNDSFELKIDDINIQYDENRIDPKVIIERGGRKYELLREGSNTHIRLLNETTRE